VGGQPALDPSSSYTLSRPFRILVENVEEMRIPGDCMTLGK
jgi:hypothetical protein